MTKVIKNSKKFLVYVAFYANLVQFLEDFCALTGSKYSETNNRGYIVSIFDENVAVFLHQKHFNTTPVSQKK